MTAPKKKTLKSKRKILDVDEAYRVAQEFVEEKKLIDSLSKRLDEKKAALVAFAQSQHGYTDDRGHRWVDFPDGSTLKHERRVSQSFNETRARSWLREEGVLDDYEREVTTVVLDQDAVLAAGFSGDIPEDVIRTFFDDRESYAFKIDWRAE
jgi:hypothetical protein